MDKELHLFVIWLNAYGARDRIIRDIQSRFSIKNVYEISWSQELFSCNMSRFYGTKLPPGSDKETRVGRGPFTLVIVEDESPLYGERMVRGGLKEMVNTNMFDAKMLYRSWTEGPEKITDRVHTTNTPKETSHDLTLLLARNPEDYYKEMRNAASWNGDIKQLNMDLAGADGWPNIKQLFYVLNSILDYVVLRNFECLPNEYHMEKHGDIDILVDNYKEACWVMNAEAVCGETYRVQNEVNVAGEKIRFDLRYVGDNYYDESWEKNILKNRVLDPAGFYKPCAEDYFYTLLYHAIIQKPAMSDDYRVRLARMAQELDINGIDKNVLADYMKEMGYNYIKPVDKSVCYNEAVISFGSRIKSYRFNYSKLFIYLLGYWKRRTWTILMRSPRLQPFRTFAGKFLKLIGVTPKNIRR